MGITNSSPTTTTTTTTTRQRSIQDNFNSNTNNNNNNRMLFFLHRTWAIIVTSSTKPRTLTRFNNNNRNNTANNNKRKKRSKNNLNDNNANVTTNSELTSEYSQYSFCSCSQCQRNRDDDFSSISFSDFFETASNMTPDNEHPSKKHNQYTFLEDIMNKDKQRPPIYNPEDYAIMLKKWGRKSSNSSNGGGCSGVGVGGSGGSGGLISLYSSSSTSDIEQNRTQNNTFRDYRNPMLISAGSEMTLRQFGTVSEMLTKLKSDLKLAYPSFVQEFVSDPLDGVTLLLDLLRAIQLNQSNTFIHGPPGSAATTGKIPPSLQRRTLLDELSCLQCLFNCCIRYTESLRKLISSSAGLFTVAVCIMSNVNKSRIIALQLLAKTCDPTLSGHSAVSEAMSTLRLRFGEPVRFRFLVGMLTSTGGQKELIAAGLNFLNKFLDTAGSNQKRLYIQAELDQAGFDINVIKTNIESGIGQEHIMREIQYWEKKNINIDNMTRRLETFRKENSNMKEKIDILERNLKVLKDEKGILVCVEKNLKERCSELQSEIRSLKSGRSSKCSYIKKRQPSTPNEDEGISSSERSLTPDDDDIPRKLLYETFSSINSETNQKPQTHKIQHHNDDNDDEETTIDEVIEELKNIINDAESEDLAKREQRKLEKEKRRIEEAQVASKLKIHIDADDYAIASESEIIPSDLHPLPPRKAKSLIHLFVPSEDYYCCPKELFFENETPCTSIEGSDSLLSSSKAPVPRNVNTPETVSATSVNMKKMTENTNTLQRIRRRSLVSKNDMKRSESLRHINKGTSSGHHGPFSYTTTVNVCESQNNLDDRTKCKSLDRVDKGLESIVDIVVTNRGFDQTIKLGKLKNDSKTTKTTSLTKSVSNVYIQNSVRPNKFSTTFEEKQRMFLPPTNDLPSDISYYFPRLKEKKSPSASFLIKRGHGNAGMYSGQFRHVDELNNDNATTNMMRHKEVLAIHGGNSGEKVTDLPSGLY